MTKKTNAEKDEHFEQLALADSHQKGEENGCVTRCFDKDDGGAYTGHNHRENGFNYQKGPEAHWYNLPIHDEGSDAHKRFKQIFRTPFSQQWRDPSQHPEVWYMDQGKYAGTNFKNGFWPWNNNAHHIVPVDDVLSKVFDLEQLMVLQQAKYNVNKGINIIILPQSTRHAELFQLLKHPKYHSTYSMQVRERVNSIKDQLNRAAKKKPGQHPEANPETLPKLGESLHNFSKQTRQDIRDAGMLKPGAHLNELFEILGAR